MRWLVIALACACGRIGFELSADAGGGGGNSISGIGCPVATGTRFDTIVAAYSVGHVEVGNEVMILSFDHDVTCAYLSNGTSWDDSASATIANGTQFLRLSLDGGDPGSYPLSGNDPPAGSHLGKATYFQTIAPGTASVQCGAADGTATVTSGGAGGAIAGSFVAAFAGGTLQGTFDAAWCPTGWYP